MECKEKVKEAFADGKRDGIAFVLNGRPFDRWKIAVYMLLNSGCRIEELAKAFDVPTSKITGAYLQVLEYYEGVLIDNQQRAIERLLAAIEAGEVDEEEDDLFC